MKTVIALIATVLIAGCAAVSDPPARLPAPEASSVQGQESLVSTLSPLEQFCENKVRLAIVLFVAREEGKTEEEILKRVQVVTKSYRDSGVLMNDSDELDFYRMTRDIFRKTGSGEYKIPAGVYVERFATVEYQNCMVKKQECPLFYSIMTEDNAATQCSDN